jgi:hypothetical protein
MLAVAHKGNTDSSDRRSSSIRQEKNTLKRVKSPKVLDAAIHPSKKMIDLANLLMPNGTILLNPTSSEPASYPYLVTMLRKPTSRLVSQLKFSTLMYPQLDTFGLAYIEELQILIDVLRKEFWKVPMNLYRIRDIFRDSTLFHTQLTSTNFYSIDRWITQTQKQQEHKAFLSGRNETAATLLSIEDMLSDTLYPNKFAPFLNDLRECLATLNGLSPMNETISFIRSENYTDPLIVRAVKERCRWRLLAQYPGMKGCQTKMILGYSCLEHRVEITPAMIKLAKDRILHGILECFNQFVPCTVWWRCLP